MSQRKYAPAPSLVAAILGIVQRGVCLHLGRLRTKETLLTLPFEFVVQGVPVSQQSTSATRKRQWTETVREAARLRWNDDLPFEGEVIASITYFREQTLASQLPIDVDNVPKLILDAMNGVVYADDSQITDLLSRRRDLGTTLSFERASGLLRRAAREYNAFVHVFVSEARAQEVTPWL